MTDTPKFCKDCAHFTGTDTCMYPRPVSRAFDLVTGKRSAPRSCDIERTHETNDSCGYTAKWFRAKVVAEAQDA
jgi:hypothetical protein